SIRPSAPLQSQLHLLEQTGLIRLAASLPELEYQFRHALIQDSAYRTLVRADRRRVHQAAGEALEALLAGTDPSAEVASQLARHFQEAGDNARALRYHTQAGDAALARYANAEAVAAYEAALAAAEKLPEGQKPSVATWQHLFEARGRALELMSRFEEAAANYQAMTARAEALAD